MACVVLTSRTMAETPREIKAMRQVESVAMFKNGLVVVKETIPISGPGAYLLEDIPKAILGTFFVESDFPVEIVVGTRSIETDADEIAGLEYWRQLQGKNVRVKTTDGTTVEGLLLYSGVDIPKLDGINSMLDQPGYVATRNVYASSYPTVVPGITMPRQNLIIRTNNETTAFFEMSQVASIETTEPLTTTKTMPIMIFEVDETWPVDFSGTISLFYLTKGMTWSPSYRVDISDAKTLTIEQNAVIANELSDIFDAEISLISGFPRIEFEQTLSLMTPDTTLLSFFNQLANVGRSRSSHIMTQQAIISNAYMPASMPEVDSQQLSANEGPDTYYHSIGRRSLDQGSRRSLLVAKKSADYERVMECKIPAFVGETQNRNDQSDSPYRKGEISEVWEVLRFDNPFDFPMTTAPVTVTGAGRFLGQNSAYWTAPAAEVTVPITRAMSVQVVCDEEERGGNIEPWEVIHSNGTASPNTENRPLLYRFTRSGSTYRKQEIDAKITVKNLRSEPVKIFLTRQISGEFLKSDIPAETKILVERDSRIINRTHELKWEIELQPGTTKEISFSYERFVNY